MHHDRAKIQTVPFDDFTIFIVTGVWGENVGYRQFWGCSCDGRLIETSHETEYRFDAQIGSHVRAHAQRTKES
jgi:hypothetical protein